MKRGISFLKHRLVVIAIMAGTLLSGMQQAAACNLDPGPLMEDLYRAIQGTAPTSNWKACLDPTFNSWSIGGSENKAVIAAAIGLYREPYAPMTPGQISYVEWWVRFLGSQTGQQVPAQTPNLRYFKGTEVMSNTYEGFVVTSVVAARYWAHVNGHAQLTDLSRRYLRATWVVYGMAAGNGPARYFNLDGRTPSLVNGQVNTSGQFVYDGPYIALAGARSTTAHWGQDDRGPLFARASGWAYTKDRESGSQKNIINWLAGRWNVSAENLFALSPTERTNLRALVTNGNNASTFLPWLTGIRTSRTFRLLGWPGPVRATAMEGNPNRNTVCFYGIAYYASNQTAYFLFPWSDAWRNGVTEGYSRVEADRIVASNITAGDTPNGFHGTRTVSLPIPTGSPQFHIVLSQNAEPYNEVSPTRPPFEPPDRDFPRNP